MGNEINGPVKNDSFSLISNSFEVEGGSESWEDDLSVVKPSLLKNTHIPHCNVRQTLWIQHSCQLQL